MERIRVKKDSNYTVINNTCLRDKELSLKAKGLFAVIMSLPDEWDFSICGLIAIVKEGKESVYSAINELISFGYCEKTEIRNKGKFFGYDYTFLEKPHTEKPHTEKPHTEKPPQLSKEELSIDVLNKDLINDSLSARAQKKDFDCFLSSPNTPPQVAPAPPSLEEIEAYFKGKIPTGSDTPQQFYNEFEAVGWLLHGSPILDWQKLANKWILRERKQKDVSTQGKKNNASYATQTTNKFRALQIQNYGNEPY